MMYDHRGRLLHREYMEGELDAILDKNPPKRKPKREYRMGLSEWIMEILGKCPEGLMKKQLLQALWTRQLMFNEASVGPILTNLKTAGRLTLQDRRWRVVVDGKA